MTLIRKSLTGRHIAVLAAAGLLAGVAAVLRARSRRQTPDEQPSPSTPTGVTGAGITARTPAGDAIGPDSDGIAPATGDVLVAEQEAAAAAEAAAIGGRVPHDSEDPAMDPVYQAGGGEQDGWEEVEAELIENATHGDGRGNPERDAFSPELEADRSTAIYGEADRIPSTEVEEDPEARPKP